MRLMLFAAILAACGLACSSKSGSKTQETPPAPSSVQDKPSLTLFLTAEMKGSIEPCGCTADPLGDLARTAELVSKAPGAVLFFDGGSTLYSDTQLSASSLTQEQLKSDLIEASFQKHLSVAAIGLGPYDLAEGVARVRPARQAVNVPADAGIALEAPKLIDANGTKVGVFGVVSPSLLTKFGITATAPAPAATVAVKGLRDQGAQVIVALAQMTRADAQTLAKEVEGIDFILVSSDLPEPKDVRIEPTQAGKTWLFRPANRGQVVSQLDLYVRDSGGFADAIGASRAESTLADLDAEISALRTALAGWEKDPDADKGFLTTKQTELDELVATQARLKKSPLQAPEKGNYFTLNQIRITKALPCNAEIIAAKATYDKAAGEANVKAAAGKKPPAPAQGKASYVGTEECGFCHDDAVKFWETTRHEKAWETLTELGKEFDFDCIACHVTGFGEPGGSNLAFNETLRDVQCETCHGPGSIHVEEDGKDVPKTMVTSPEEALCVTCHSIEHSDTFNFQAYLRDITGPGHGASLRAALGAGDTAHELRKAAKAKASTTLGAGCTK